jgi:hypothetical protein
MTAPTRTNVLFCSPAHQPCTDLTENLSTHRHEARKVLQRPREERPARDERNPHPGPDDRAGAIGLKVPK